MRQSLFRSESGVSNLVYLAGGGLLLILLTIGFFGLQSNDTSNEVDQATQSSLDELQLTFDEGTNEELDLRSLTPPIDVTQLVDFGDIPNFAGPPVGNFEFVDQSFIPINQVLPGSTPHLIVATDGNPPVETHMPIRFAVYDATTGASLWDDTLNGDPNLVCRGVDGCSLNGPPADGNILTDPPVPLLLLATSGGDDLLARAALLPNSTGGFDVDLELDDLVQELDEIFMDDGIVGGN